MLENAGTHRVVLLVLVVSYLTVCSGWIDPSRLFLDLAMYKASCGYGMVAGKDHFEVNGLINITNMPYGFIAKFALYYRDLGSDKSYMIKETLYSLYHSKCNETAVITIGSCQCTFLDLHFIKFKCRLMARTVYSRSDIMLIFYAGARFFSPSFRMPPVYESPECIEPSISQATRSHPKGFSALLGTALLGTAVVRLVSSLFSQG
ncbi:unnamed protein product [Lymnaea stagnalis]|uniref:Uncharacterized protein n=1 Tax=Lymnaea stagnalis TaxID=6523 RepID=A0AAV2HQW6_LYMST